MKKVAKIYRSFAEQEADEIRYWQQLSPEKKLEILEIIRMQYWAMHNETPGRLLPKGWKPKEFIELLNKHKVRYLIIGGYAVSSHSPPHTLTPYTLYPKPYNQYPNPQSKRNP